MCRKRALVATLLAPVVLLAAPAFAADAPKPAPAAEAPKVVKASPQQRAEARRLDPLAQSAFWGAEF